MLAFMQRWPFRGTGLGKKYTKQAVMAEFFKSHTAHEPRGFWRARLETCKEGEIASAEGASGEKLRHSMRGLCKCALPRHCAWQTMLKTSSTLRLLQSHSFTNPSMEFTRFQNKVKTMLASAEGASGDNLEHSMRVLRKSGFCATVLGKNCTKHEVL